MAILFFKTCTYLMKKIVNFLLLFLLLGAAVSFISSGCAQIGAPTGGLKDTLPPVLLKAVPQNKQLNFKENKITLTFNEYIELQDLSNNILVSPYQKNMPVIGSNLKTISIKIKDSLLPNTTYSIEFGNAIKDINEGNVLTNFIYTFSTGQTIDSLSIKGTVLMAETGKVDSTLMVLLYKNLSDSDVTKRKPDYIAKVNGNGAFVFKYLPSDPFFVYALKDGDGSKTYNAATEIFAFNNTAILSSDTTTKIALLAYAQEKKNTLVVSAAKKQPEKKLKYQLNGNGRQQDLLQPLILTFNNPIKTFQSSEIVLSDTNFVPLSKVNYKLDSTNTKITIEYNWQADSRMMLVINKEAVSDSVDNLLSKSDTIKLTCNSKSNYGSVLLRFKNLDNFRHPVLQFMQGEIIKYAYSIQSTEWSNSLFPPGEYDLRILYDENNNGVWDPGNYKTKKQPEQTISLSRKISIKADWDNESEIDMKEP